MVADRPRDSPADPKRQGRLADRITALAGSLGFGYMHLLLVRCVDRHRRRGGTPTVF
jgi:hypothetical protein